jgi:DNA replication protein DnaC
MEARDERRLRALQKHLNTVKLLIVDELGARLNARENTTHQGFAALFS